MTVAAYFNRRGFVHDKKAPSSGLVPATIPLDGPSNDAAWRAQHLRRLAGPAFTPLDGPVFTPLDGPVFTPLDGSSNDAAWRVQCLCCLAGPVFMLLGSQLWIFCDTQSDRSCRFSAAAIRSGKRSGVQAKTDTPRLARKAAWLLS